MDGPKELSLREIRQYMLDNGCRVTNHALVKYFKSFLTHPQTQNEARKEFKTYVNILATIKNENNQKYLILRKKYLHECPSDDVVNKSNLQVGGSDSVPSSPGGVSLSEDHVASPFRQPPPYKPPPEVSTPIGTPVYSAPLAPIAPVVLGDTDPNVVDTKTFDNQRNDDPQTPTPHNELDNKSKEMMEKAVREKSLSRGNSIDATANKENIPRFSFSSGSSGTDSTDQGGDKSSGPDVDTENPISVKEATRKFNRMASEEEAKIISPPTKKKQEKLIEEKELPEVPLTHPKAKEWIVSMAKGNYQELAKLANEYPELVKLQHYVLDILDVQWNTTTPEAIDINLHIVQRARGVYGLSGFVDFKVDIDADEALSEVKIYYSRNGISYQLSPFHLPLMSFTNMLNGPYKQNLMEKFKECCTGSIEADPFVSPLKKRLIECENCFYPSDHFPSAMRPGYYKVVIIIANRPHMDVALTLLMKLEPDI